MMEHHTEPFRANGNMLPVAVAILAAAVYFFFKSSTYKLRHIPTVGGSSNVILSYLGSLRFNFHGQEMFQQGYEKYNGSAFKVPSMTRWLVVISGSQMVEDVRRANDDYMSLDESDFEALQAKYTIGKAIFFNHWHANFLRAPLTKHLSNQHEDIRDEITRATADVFQMKGNESMQIAVHLIAKKIIARATSRMFVGVPLCRNLEYLDLSEKFTMDVFLSSHIINIFPKALHPLLGWFVSGKVAQTVKRIEPYIRHLIEDYLKQKGRPAESNSNDIGKLVCWMVDDAMQSGRPIDTEDFTRRILGTNFLSIGAMAAVLTDALFNLAAHPEHAGPMRQEIETVLQADGWTKASIAKMVKVDSFIKETQRLGTGGTTGHRKLLKDFTFSNGIFLPAGTCFAFATHSTHRDEKLYKNPAEFQGFRFVDTAAEDMDDPKHQMVSLTPEYLIFGTGRHACPGRFFAAFVLKVAFAQILLDYDVEFPKDCRLPDHKWFQNVCLPDVEAELIFKKRG